MDVSRSLIDSNIEGWPYQPELCPCDDHFIDYLDKERVQSPGVFHMGPGLHHKVPRYVTGTLHGWCQSITVSRPEWENASISGDYRCIWADIYRWQPDKEIKFMYVTLFHIGEMIQDVEPATWTFMRMVDQLFSGGKILLYTGSSAWDRVQHIPFLTDKIILLEEFKTLQVWRKR